MLKLPNWSGADLQNSTCFWNKPNLFSRASVCWDFLMSIDIFPLFLINSNCFTFVKDLGDGFFIFDINKYIPVVTFVQHFIANTIEKQRQCVNLWGSFLIPAMIYSIKYRYLLWAHNRCCYCPFFVLYVFVCAPHTKSEYLVKNLIMFRTQRIWCLVV